MSSILIGPTLKQSWYPSCISSSSVRKPTKFISLTKMYKWLHFSQYHFEVLNSDLDQKLIFTIYIKPKLIKITCHLRKFLVNFKLFLKLKKENHKPRKLSHPSLFHWFLSDLTLSFCSYLNLIFLIPHAFPFLPFSLPSTLLSALQMCFLWFCHQRLISALLCALFIPPAEGETLEREERAEGGGKEDNLELETQEEMETGKSTSVQMERKIATEMGQQWSRRTKEETRRLKRQVQALKAKIRYESNEVV